MMKRYLTFLLPLALVPATGAGQRFFDDFDGEDLGGHWQFGDGKGRMIYSVHDSLLEVYRVDGPFSTNRDRIYTQVHRFADFELTARVGWLPGNRYHEMYVSTSETPGGGFVGGMAYIRRKVGEEWVSRVAVEFGDGPRAEFAAPDSGFHEFRVSRRGSTFFAFFDGNLVLQSEGTTREAGTVTLGFGAGSYEPVDMMVDRVSLVPEPGSIAWLAAGVAVVALRRRRTR